MRPQCGVRASPPGPASRASPARLPGHGPHGRAVPACPCSRSPEVQVRGRCARRGRRRPRALGRDPTRGRRWPASRDITGPGPRRRRAARVIVRSSTVMMIDRHPAASTRGDGAVVQSEFGPKSTPNPLCLDDCDTVSAAHPPGPRAACARQREGLGPGPVGPWDSTPAAVAGAQGPPHASLQRDQTRSWGLDHSRWLMMNFNQMAQGDYSRENTHAVCLSRDPCNAVLMVRSCCHTRWIPPTPAWCSSESSCSKTANTLLKVIHMS